MNNLSTFFLLLVFQFFTFLLIILVAEIAGGVWAYTNQSDVKKRVEQRLEDLIRRDYGVDEVTTTTFDFLQQKLECCGATSYASWANAGINTGNHGTTSALEAGLSALSPAYVVPKSCCAKPDSNVCETTRRLGPIGYAAGAVSGNVYVEVISSIIFRPNFETANSYHH